MTPLRHMSAEALLRHALGGRLAAAEARHLADCPRCREDLADFVALAAALRGEAAASPVTSPSAAALARTLALLPTRRPTGAAARRFVTATPSYDSVATFGGAGLRAVAEGRHVIWSSPEADLDVKLQAAGPGTRPLLLGQVLPRLAPPAGDGGVWLTEPRRPAQFAALGVGGEFTFPAPAGARWTLWLEWGPIKMKVNSR